MKPLQGQAVLVTGAAKRIGRGLALALGEAGARVAITWRDSEAQAGQTLKDLEAAGVEAAGFRADLRNPALIREAVEKAAAHFGRLDILVNNAGIAAIGKDGAPSVTDFDAVRTTIETNFIGALAVTQAMLPLLRKSKAASIVNVSSELGSITGHTTPDWKFAHVRAIGYSASKAAMNMMTAQLALELAGTPIKVNSANPGFTATDLNQHRGHQTVKQGAAETIRLALIGPDGPTGGFFETGGKLPW